MLGFSVEAQQIEGLVRVSVEDIGWVYIGQAKLNCLPFSAGKRLWLPNSPMMVFQSWHAFA